MAATADTALKIVIPDQLPPANDKQLQQSIGYGRAANRAIELANTPYLLLLNTDLIATADDVDQLLSRMLGLGNSAAILAPAVTQKDFLGEGLVQRNWAIGAAMLRNLKALKPDGAYSDRVQQPSPSQGSIGKTK